MHRSRLARKLKPAKRAWRSFTSKLKSKLESLNIPNAIKTTTHGLIRFCSHHLLMPLKNRFVTKSASRRHFSYLYHNDHLLHKNFAAIYIDHLYQEPPPPPLVSKTEHVKGSNAAETQTGSSSSTSGEVLNSIEDAWQAIVAKSPQLRGVDERAEEFIYKFREDMKIQRERSLLEYQQMLARASWLLSFNFLVTFYYKLWKWHTKIVRSDEEITYRGGGFSFVVWLWVLDFAELISLFFNFLLFSFKSLCKNLYPNCNDISLQKLL